jgi:hypothetical protein
MKLTGIERVWARDVLDSMYPRDADPVLPTGIVDLDVDAYLDDLGRSWPRLTFLVFRFAIVCIALAPFVLLRRLRTFHQLSRSERLRVIERMYASNAYVVRQLVVLVKAAGGIFYGASMQVREVLIDRMPPPPTDALVQLRRKHPVHA